MSSLPASHFWRTLLAVVVASVSLNVAASAAADGSATDAKSEKSDKADNSEKSTKSKKSGKAEKADASAEEDKSKGEFTAEKIAKVVGTESELGGDYKVTAAVNGKEIIIQTWASPKAPANMKDRVNDQKIDAVLITKKIMDAFPKTEIASCKVRYFDRNERTRYLEVYVVPGVVTSFASGALDQESMLATLPYNVGDTNPAATTTTATATNVTPPAAEIDPKMTRVLPGVLENERAKALMDILALEKKGSNIPVARNQLVIVEQAAQSGDAQKTRTTLDALVVIIKKLQQDQASAKIRAAVKAATAGPGTSTSTSGGGDKAYLPKGVSPDDPNAKHYLEMRSLFGEFWPHWGPFHPDRKRLALALMDYQKKAGPMQARLQQIKAAQKKGMELSTEDLIVLKQEPIVAKLPALIQQFKQMEVLAINGAPGPIEVAVKQMNLAMGLKELPHDATYKMGETQAKEWQQEGYQ
ncbi:MAG: hypothetical protein K2W95_16710 [Candidatus Obscuribacterales bacterium]|nr:hypothetical protein [Candidatus Obscuribacterales bacterium]